MGERYRSDMDKRHTIDSRQRHRLTFLVGLNVGLSVGLEDGSFVGDDEGDNEGVAVGVV